MMTPLHQPMTIPQSRSKEELLIRRGYSDDGDTSGDEEEQYFSDD
jgi:hypothetical protein